MLLLLPNVFFKQAVIIYYTLDTGLEEPVLILDKCLHVYSLTIVSIQQTSTRKRHLHYEPHVFLCRTRHSTFTQCQVTYPFKYPCLHPHWSGSQWRVRRPCSLAHRADF